MDAYFRSLKDIFYFAIPIIAGQLGHMLFGIGDMVVAGHYSTQVLSALGIATAIFSPFLIIGGGITFAISPIKARMLAQGKDVSAVPATALLLALSTGLLLMVLIFATGLVVDRMGFTPEIAALVHAYIMICAPSIVPDLAFLSLKETLQARENTVFANGLICGFNFFNVGVNVYLMFILDMGIQGAAVATLLSRFLMAACLYIYTRRTLKFSYRVSLPLLKEFFTTGIPIGVNGVMVGLVFSLVTLLSGRMSVVTSAANNILINITSLTYMVPFALSSAASVKVGQAWGRQDLHRVKIHALATVSLGLLSACVMATLFYTIPKAILSLATSDAAVIQYGVGLLFFGAIYQIPDAIQTTLQGSLRGLGITFSPMVCSLVGFWGVGFPLGCYLAYERQMEAAGLWMGLAMGLSVLAVLNSILFFRAMRKKRSRMELTLQTVSK